MTLATRVSLAVLLLATSTVASSTVQPKVEAPEGSGSAAFLFVYRPKSGVENKFDEGYKKHLDWHRQHRDALPWYAWYVSSGDRLGLFIDGTFGISFGAFDHRVDPAADAADFRENVGPLAEPITRATYRVRPELSTARPLEARRPTANIEALHIVLRPGTERSFERVVGELATARRAAGAPNFTCYQLVTGGEIPGYLVLVARDGWTMFDGAAATPLDVLLGTGTDDKRRREIELAVERSVVRMHAETWSYRSDLSLIPSAAPPSGAI